MLMKSLWAESWIGESDELRSRAARKFDFYKTTACDGDYVNDIRSSSSGGGEDSLIEFGVVREPLTRFISAYYYIGAYMAREDRTRFPRNISKHGGYAQLKMFVNTLPPSGGQIVCDMPLHPLYHIYPEYVFLCSSSSGSSGCKSENKITQSVSSGQSLSEPGLKDEQEQGVQHCNRPGRNILAILTLENLDIEWSEFIRHIIAPGVSLNVPMIPKRNVNMFNTRDISPYRSHVSSSSSSVSSSLFSKFNIEHSDSYEITSKLCLYLESDYEMLRDYYPLPEECAKVLMK
jgi:hypothetical protein